jgi:nucleotide-binding universal stress UspA family protein
MPTTAQEHFVKPALAGSIFDRVLVGVDDSPEALEAARQAAALTTGSIALLAAYDPAGGLVGGGGMPPAPVFLDEESVREAAEHALDHVNGELSPLTPVRKVTSGRAWLRLLEEIDRRRHTLVAVGSHGAGRAKGIVIGSTATELIHKAPCSVLVARRPLKRFPSRVVVGLDGSKQAAVAEAVADDLAKRFGASLERFESVGHPVSTLVEAGMEADLLVVGSRGLHGIKALGSVSERVAHEARCSVLIVR